MVKETCLLCSSTDYYPWSRPAPRTGSLDSALHAKTTTKETRKTGARLQQTLVQYTPIARARREEEFASWFTRIGATDEKIWPLEGLT